MSLQSKGLLIGSNSVSGSHRRLSEYLLGLQSSEDLFEAGRPSSKKVVSHGW